GLVRKHTFDDGTGRPPQACYELDHGEHHDHMVDIETGDVLEFVDEEIEALQEKIAERHGFEIVDHSMVLYVRRIKEPSGKR
ncbi:MAG: transcriptional repressor, partial [Wenzhouxiangellaceae bacterium]|nr:transcriptional repressor [Wenzhouxiangellaceae bacterium]